MPQARYVVTGASGFVGTRFAARIDGPHSDIALAPHDWQRRIDACDFTDAIVIHLAARAHRSGSRADFQRDNVEKTRALARAAARAGARRFVFLSSIKVNGEATTSRPFTPSDGPAPEDEYGRSKRDAELALADVSLATGLDTVVVRCPLVFGAPAKGNLATLLRICDSALPLPFASVRNRRSFIALDDLCDALMQCARVEAARGKTYLVAHREPVSTPRLITAVRAALRRPARLFAVPPPLLEAAATSIGLGGTMKRLTRSLELDASLAESDLAWSARTDLESAVGQMVEAYRG
jgi:nucleoside-diphosphate-sugar epimerase